MNDSSDSQLLSAYSEHRSEAAFSELVRRHVDLVYSAAVRIVRDPHLAQDVTQAVFIALSRSAVPLAGRPSISGWLHCTTRNSAAQLVRTIERRRANEREAVAMNELNSGDNDTVWEQIAPHLDNALGELNDADREAVLLRYFQNRDFRTVGRALGISDDTAQKRVSRAVERLREMFAKRGISVGASGLAGVLSVNAVQAAPVGLAVTISSSAALTGTTIITTATVTATKTIAMTTLQKALIGTVLVAAISTPTALHYRANQALRVEKARLLRESAQLREMKAENEEMSTRLAQATRLRQLTTEQMSELLRLRGSVGQLRQENAKLKGELTNSLAAGPAPAAPPTQAANDAESKQPEGFPTLNGAPIQNSGLSTPQHAATTFIWSIFSAKGEDGQQVFASPPNGEPGIDAKEAENQFEMLRKTLARVTDFQFLDSAQDSEEHARFLYDLVGTEGLIADAKRMTLELRMQRQGNEWRLVHSLIGRPPSTAIPTP